MNNAVAFRLGILVGMVAGIVLVDQLFVTPMTRNALESGVEKAIERSRDAFQQKLGRHPTAEEQARIEKTGRAEVHIDSFFGRCRAMGPWGIIVYLFGAIPGALAGLNVSRWVIGTSEPFSKSLEAALSRTGQESATQ